MKILLELSYDGSAYHGWQVQKNAPSVQSAVQNAAEQLLGAPCAVTGCSRTDAGVHARQYFCTLESDALDGVPPARLPGALDRFLPPDVALKSARPVDASFHARYSVIAKEYEYLISTAFPRDPFLARRVWALPGATPDAEVMAREARAFEGKRDFTSFCASGGKPGDRTRTVYYCRVERRDEGVSLRICADGFLYNMVRIAAGTLLECGLGRCGGVEGIILARDRAAAGRTAPAKGLYLDRVFYEEDELSARIAALG